MALERCIALIILMICLAYGYAAFFTMDATLPPFMQRNPVWPSTFPKILSVIGALVALSVVLGLEKTLAGAKSRTLITRAWVITKSVRRYSCWV